MRTHRQSTSRIAIVVAVSVLCLAASSALAAQADGGPTLSVDNGTVAVGETTTVPITLSSLPNGLAGYNVTVTVDGGATVVNASVNQTLGLRHANVSSDGTAATFGGVDLQKAIEPGTDRTTLGTLTVRGEHAGNASVSVRVNVMNDDEGGTLDPRIDGGVLRIGSSTGDTGGESGDRGGGIVGAITGNPIPAAGGLLLLVVGGVAIRRFTG